MNYMSNKTSTWLNQKFLQWQQAEGERKTIGDFAQYLCVGEAALGHWMNGRRDPSFKNAVAISGKLKDPEILELLGFNQVEFPFLESFPKDVRERLLRAKADLNLYLIASDSSPDSPESEVMVKEILGKYGITVSSKTVED
jgi:hypothetical protein